MRKILCLLFCLPLLCFAARPLPLNATLGDMASYSPQNIKIDGKTYQGGAGLRVYNTDGLIIMPAAVPQRSPVLFQLEPAGYVWKIWLLTDDEAKSVKQAQQAAKEAAAQQ
ncbi:hypothetical protein SAMN02745857_00399 [Andreprevotia lacus DSM 23236]|jgi:hypothetical protein|uniref:Uncharacterized protein n=1 Tax=Andreprevotia lacus DSM 23236 TaxID=1121001 RepID=A0A1W1X1W5_9NEIS|nr:hypothetical protein [Andreprevotia lacus]SMC17760.1 hypothetical protein SAMN02745857_00399 [Andreprevotia lacus DSM 23236]